MTRAQLPGYPAAVLAGVRAAEIDGRLPAPDAETLGDIFPFETPLTVVPFAEPQLPEPQRPGERDASDCTLCGQPDSDYFWVNDAWRLKAWRREGVHAVILEPRAHVDIDGLTDAQASDLGRLIVRIERAMRGAIDGVGRVHVHRWGDGMAHLHVWFIARPAGLLQLRGSALPLWLDVLPPLPEDVWRADLDRLAATLGTG